MWKLEPQGFDWENEGYSTYEACCESCDDSVWFPGRDDEDADYFLWAELDWHKLQSTPEGDWFCAKCCEN